MRYDGTPPFAGAGPRGLRPPDRRRSPTGVYVGIMDVLDLRLDPATVPFVAVAVPGRPDARPSCAAGRASPTGGSPTRLSLLFLTDAIPPATLMIGSTGLGPHAADVDLRAGAAGAGLARHPHDGRPGRRRDGRRDVRAVGQPRCHVVGQSTQLARLRFPDEAG